MNSDDKVPVYIILGITFTVGLCAFTNLVLDYIATTTAIQAGLVQELKTENDVTRVIWVKDNQND